MAAHSQSKSANTSRKSGNPPTVYLEQETYDRLKDLANAKGFKLRHFTTRIIEIGLDKVIKEPNLLVA